MRWRGPWKIGPLLLAAVPGNEATVRFAALPLSRAGSAGDKHHRNRSCDRDLSPGHPLSLTPRHRQKSMSVNIRASLKHTLRQRGRSPQRRAGKGLFCRGKL